MNYITLFTFSPVQSFIQSSRKLKDFFISSYILSFLTEETIKRSRLENNTIFPVLTKSEDRSIANYPNRFIVKTEDKDLCKKLKDNFKKVWQEIYNSVFNELKKEYSNIENVKDQFYLHVENYFSSFCHTQEFIDYNKWKEYLDLKEENKFADLNSYAYTYDLTERILGSIKSKRFYKPLIDNHPNADGCTLCGERLHINIDWEVFRKKFPNSLTKGEKLCGVCLVKRFALDIYFKNRKLTIPSVEEVAAIKFKENLIKEKNISEEINKILKPIYENNNLRSKFAMSDNPIFKENEAFIKVDGEIFRRYNDPTLSEEIKKEYKEKDFKDFEKVIEDLSNFFKKEGKDFVHKNPYYAILIADGDDMGKWLGLDKEKRGKPLTEEFHTEFSKKLSEFASKAIKHENIKFLPIYAGGDDIFTLLHPKDTVDFIKDKADEFKMTLYGQGSISGGILITHVKTNLQLSLREAFNLEKKAKKHKKQTGKGSLCIGVLTHSGTLKDSVFNIEDIDIFKRLIQYFEEEILSLNLPYTLREIEKVSDINIFKTLLKRYIVRKVKNNSTKEEIIKTIENLKDKFQTFKPKEKNKFKTENISNQEEKEFSSENILNALYIAKFIAKI